MIDPQKLRELGRPLEDWFAQVGISLKPGDEKLNRLTHREDISAEAVAAIPDEPYKELADTYGKALTLMIKLGGRELYSLSGAFDQANLDAFRLELASGDIVGMVTVYIELDKYLLADQVLESPADIKATVVFQPTVLTGILSEPIVDLDQRAHPDANPEDALSGDDAFKQVILVPELDVWVNGERLAIVGGNGLTQLADTLVPSPLGASEIQQVRELSERNIKWIRLDPPRLTPLHFDVKVNEELTGDEAEELLDLLAWLQARLSLIYLGDSTQRARDGSLVVAFIGAGGSSQISLPRDLPKDKDFRSILQSGASILQEDCLWAYADERRVVDRLATVQSVIAQVFPGPDDDSHMRKLLHEAATVHGFISEHWKIFCEGKVDQYFDKVKQISEFVAAATRSYGEQIDALIKSLSSTMLGAVVTVVGTFVGSLLSDKFNPVVFIIGLGAYTGYLAIFPGVIGLTNAWQHFAETRERMRRQFEELKSRVRLVDEEGWKSLEEQLTRSERRFKGWFLGTVMAYGLVCVLAVVAILAIPQMLVANSELTTLAPGS